MARFEKLVTRNDSRDGRVVVFFVRSTGTIVEKMRFNVDVGSEQLFVDIDVFPHASTEVLVKHHRSRQQQVRVEDPLAGVWIRGTFDLDLAECLAACESGVQAGQVDRVVRDLVRVLESQPHNREAAQNLHDAVRRLIDELARIGLGDGFLSTAPGGLFDEENRHIRTRQIGSLIAEIGAVGAFRADGEPVSITQLMGAIISEVEKRIRDGKSSGHLTFAWDGIGGWYP